MCYGGVGDGYLDSRRWQQFANSVQLLKDSKIGAASKFFSLSYFDPTLACSNIFNLNFKRFWAPMCYGGVGDGYLDSRRWQQFANSVQSLKDSPTTDCYLCAIALLCSRRVPHKSREKSSKSIKNFYQCIFISHGHE